MMNENELMSKLCHRPKSQIRLIGSNQKVSGKVYSFMLYKSYEYKPHRRKINI
jgi:hypothetical protein